MSWNEFKVARERDDGLKSRLIFDPAHREQLTEVPPGPCEIGQ